MLQCLGIGCEVSKMLLFFAGFRQPQSLKTREPLMRDEHVREYGHDV